MLQNNTYAIYLYNTSSNLQNNNINNTEFGVRIAYSHDVNVSDSRIDNSLYSGIELDEAVNVTINNNTVQNSTQGFTFSVPATARSPAIPSGTQAADTCSITLQIQRLTL